MVNNNNDGHTQDPAIKPRRMSFPFQQMKAHNFFDDNSLKSSFVAALSATFPPGEGEFINSVRNYQDQITDPKLKEQIRGFVTQEAHHSHQHKQANIAISKLGWDAKRLEVSLQAEIEKYFHRRSNRFRLAMTVGMEHLTAILAEHVLENPYKIEPMEPAARQLLYWHSVEEIEHKAVAFDVYMQCEGDQKYLRRALRIGFFLFALRISIYMMAMMWWAKKWPTWSEAKSFYSFLFSKEEGFMTALKKPYKDYFQPGFHPWQHANQHLIDKWKKELYNPECDKGSDQYVKPEESSSKLETHAA
ncbi:metal-dependent hydrolase [Pelagibaculum spongiae]|uniref:Metal-dependent hydrolase n=1 Tax=Pelagibaculum spongiae TaxID=2080658 RepID=A0A2V1GXJ2_9GAMM|nr:metal-dependent hydrolase [Pelagibaculum spongiae]PVZ71506.1 metal-dependent hydrolase [Pelagibaculum spongiae]